jgi:hypothetical protein
MQLRMFIGRNFVIFRRISTDPGDIWRRKKKAEERLIAQQTCYAKGYRAPGSQLGMAEWGNGQ